MNVFLIGFEGFFVIFFVSFLIAALLAGPIFKILLAAKSRQTVSQYVPEHAGKQGTPTMGGLIIAAGFIGAMLIAIFLFFRDSMYPPGLRYYAACLLLFVAYTAIGFVDDYVVPRMMKGKRGLGWTQKLVMQFLAAGAFLALLGRSMTPMEIALGLFVVVFFANAYNFADGMDFLAGSILLCLVLGLAIISRVTEDGALVPLAALAGGALPFLYLNRPPAKIFMGDVGALPIGAILGLVVAGLAVPSWGVGVLEGGHYPGHFEAHPPMTALGLAGLVILSFVMLAELVPVPLQILSVKLRNKRIFPATPIHHSFQRAGWPEGKVVRLFVGVQLACALLGAGLAYYGWAKHDSDMRKAFIEHLQEFPRQPER
ncbi:hypothetical protein [Fimbriimonas ginsengisoli]|uniref:Phospho-N-acetylmuramoyl-pentapeptide-transferase n=1 Tax=Fimbriimonas ginsengisoli Gsoil 348 TaxID=661478 RepID=A0A068NXS8_FIMGI|nr:hypothetical protein [Fimbriimonas ginsengisoli]AIE88157.1 phospho-N-acetylmuramoyl-pentapeptide-transferase [Fimbriimonas ginsengisoli Gsoil 348]